MKLDFFNHKCSGPSLYIGQSYQEYNLVWKAVIRLYYNANVCGEKSDVPVHMMPFQKLT